MKLRRRLKVTAQGKELYKFINGIRSEGIVCLGQYVRHDVFHGEIYRRDLKKLRKTAEEFDVELREAEFVSAMGIMWGYRKRIGIILGIIAASLACLWFSQTVVNIEIQGNSAVSDDVILSALSQLNVRQGTFIKGIDMHYCEHELQIRVDGIAWAAMRRTGNRIVVQVTETEPKPKMLLKRVPCNVVSAKDAEITEVNVCDGMLMHKVGDYVPKGTLLINGVAEDDTGHMTIHHAFGSIKGIYTETAEFRGELHPQTYIPTGRKKTERFLRLFNVDIPLFFGKNSFENAETETHERMVSLFGKRLPVGIISRKCSETALTETELSEEKVDKELMKKMYLFEKNFLGECRLIKRDVKRDKDGDILVFRAEYRVEGEIGEEREIFMK